ncbi:leucine-rich repeat and coiled-coil domain-containing protein 1-like isoform X2 [Zootermopsis nevadensis]|nr:leucine-rich repeat and coiled-coil domain-containing protein 1-like isoform X2 [Zootermopsis nevadensis]XP_021942429.1 leucine-rich repeat and coiled-coil domain-containing protein 1-like isoform X2 [Zootermopsis nevadensis]
MLIQAVEQLEQEAADRVSLLQESLQRSSQAAVAYMTKLDDFDKGVSVEKDKDSIIEDLKAELLSLRMKLKKCGYGKRSNGSELKEEVIALKEDNELKEGKIQGYIRRFQELGDSMHDKSCQVVIETQPRGKSSDDKYFEELDVCLNKALQEKSELVKQVEQLKTQLKESVVEIEQLSKAVNDKDQSAKDMRKALTAEVADKHDQNLALRREIQLLEERYRQADMQTHFRDVIIKEMRKDLKVARLKLASIDLDQQNPVVCNGQKCMSSFLPSNHPTCQSQFSSVQPNSE